MQIPLRYICIGYLRRYVSLSQMEKVKLVDFEISEFLSICALVISLGSFVYTNRQLAKKEKQLAKKEEQKKYSDTFVNAHKLLAESRLAIHAIKNKLNHDDNDSEQLQRDLRAAEASEARATKWLQMNAVGGENPLNDSWITDQNHMQAFISKYQE